MKGEGGWSWRVRRILVVDPADTLSAQVTGQLYPSVLSIDGFEVSSITRPQLAV